jgi:hypothetical protein
MGCALWVESYGLRLFSERTTRNSQLFKLACLSRLRQCRHRLETGRGTRDEGRNKLGRGSCRARTAASSEWRVANGERKSSTRNAQPNFTLYALRFQPISGLTPLLPINFTHYASRITLYASRFTHHESRPFSKIANFAVKSVKSRITNHAPDGYQMTTEVVII